MKETFSLQVSIAGMLFCAAAALLIPASAGDMREFVVCEHAIGKQRGPILHDGVKITGVFRAKPETVVRLIEIAGDKCTLIVTSNGVQVSVVGSAEEVECRLLGGNGCATRKPGKQ